MKSRRLGLIGFAFVFWKFFTNENAGHVLAARTVIWFIVSFLVWRTQEWVGLKIRG